MNIGNEEYSLSYYADSSTVVIKGMLRLNGIEDYTPISAFLEQIGQETDKPYLHLDLNELNFLNSSGFSILSRFIMSLRQKEGLNVVIKASNKVAWQTKSLKNLKRLMPKMDIEWE